MATRHSITLLFAGGGTLGPVTPLLAVASVLHRKRPAWKIHWVGTASGPERAWIEERGMVFTTLPVVKWTSYPSKEWLRALISWMRARRQARRIIDQYKPSAIVGAGGFTALPLMLVARNLSIPCLMHQLDVVPGLTNRRVARWCVSITTSFEYERSPFGMDVSDERIPTPVRIDPRSLPTRMHAVRHFDLDPFRPVTLVMGGGTGARAINEMIIRSLATWLPWTQIVHVTGIGKDALCVKNQRTGYVVRTHLIDEMPYAYAAADVVVSRAGMGTLSEIAALALTAVLIPLPNSTQEVNARAFEEQGAALVFDQNETCFAERVREGVRLLVSDLDERKKMGERARAFLPTDDGTALAERVVRAVETSLVST